MPPNCSPILIRDRHVRVAESWLDSQPDLQQGSLRAQGADVVYFREALKDARDAKLYRASARHGVIALDRPPETLLDAMNPGFRNEVRRAAKESIQSCIAPADPDSPGFAQALCDYDAFHAERGLTTVPHRNLRTYSKHGMLWLATASLGLTDIRTHFYICSAQEALLIASFPRTQGQGEIKPAAKGWANRRLHYDCIQHFHHAGCLRYNLGGIGNTGSTNNQDIIKFKMEMRPEIGLRYSYARPLTAKGHLYLLVRKFLRS
jgi:hypothetical protein